MRTRIAPTPSGLLHAGNGASFILSWKLARAAGGKLLLRIDDLDAARARPEYVQDIFDTLAWLGIDFDEGPRTLGEFTRHWSQQLRMGQYRSALAQLREQGSLYACDCSRRAVQARTGGLDYDGHCRGRGLDLDAPDVAWRLRLPEGAQVDLHPWPQGRTERHRVPQSDPVLRQRDGRPAYQLASVLDDSRFGVDLIVRGMDLLPSTLVQLHLAEVLGLARFRQARFLHHALVVDARGAKLSKSEGADALLQWRRAGRSPQALHQLAERLLHAGGPVPINGPLPG